MTKGAQINMEKIGIIIAQKYPTRSFLILFKKITKNYCAKIAIGLNYVISIPE